MSSKLFCPFDLSLLWSEVKSINIIKISQKRFYVCKEVLKFVSSDNYGFTFKISGTKLSCLQSEDIVSMMLSSYVEYIFFV